MDLLCVLQIIMQYLHLFLNHPYRIQSDCQANGELVGTVSKVVNEFDGLVWVALGFPLAGNFTHEDAGQRGIRIRGVSRKEDHRFCGGGMETSEFEERDLKHTDRFDVPWIILNKSRTYLDVPRRIQFAREHFRDTFESCDVIKLVLAKIVPLP